jgi:cysteine-rich repeat protein
MRIHILAALALALPACAGEISSPSGGDDTSATCGNGAVDQGEQCDDGNAAGGDGCSASCQMEATATPALAMTADKQTIATELMTSNTVTVTLTGSGGFQGDVNLTASLVDASSAPITGWSVALDHSTVTLATNGTGTAVATVTIPSENKALMGTLKIDATTTVSGVTTPTVSTDITAANQVTFAIGFDPNVGCVYPQGLNNTNPEKVTVGSKVRFVNMAQTNNSIAIHSNGAGEGICHEDQPCGGDQALPSVIAPNMAYEQTAKTPGNPFSWYCHQPGPDLSQGNPFLQVVN